MNRDNQSKLPRTFTRKVRFSLVAAISAFLGAAQIGQAQSTEAENYDDQSGTQLVNNGSAVGYIQAGDYFGFDNVTLPEASQMQEIEISLAVPARADNQDDLLILTLGGPQGLKLAYLDPAPTGGWLDYEIQAFNTGALDAYAGNTVDLYFTFEGSGYIVDVDSFRFVPEFTEGEDYDFQSGTQLVDGGTAVGYIQAGDYIGFENVTLPSDFDDIEISLAVHGYENNSDDRIILTIGSPQGLKLASLAPSATGGWSNYEIQTFNAGALTAYAGNTLDFYFTFEGSGYIVNIDSFRFVKGP